MPKADTAAASCPHCAARLQSEDTACWLCGGRINTGFPSDQRVATEANVPPTLAPNTALTFNLSSLMLIITLIAVCLGVFRLAPGLGIAAAVLATPALIRTMIFSKRRRARGDALNVGEKTLAFVGSVGVVLTICVGACAAFGAVCFGTAAIVCYSTQSMGGGRAAIGIQLAIGGAVVIGLAVGGLLAWKLWPKLR